MGTMHTGVSYKQYIANNHKKFTRSFNTEYWAKGNKFLNTTCKKSDVVKLAMYIPYNNNNCNNNNFPNTS